MDFDKTSDGRYHDVSLSGSAHIVFSGIVKYDFLPSLLSILFSAPNLPYS